MSIAFYLLAGFALLADYKWLAFWLFLFGLAAS